MLTPSPMAGRSVLTSVVLTTTPFLVVLALLLTTGALEDSQRDQPVLLTITVAMSLAGGVLLAIWPSSRLVGFGVFVAGIGIAIAIFLAASGASPESRPGISASFDEPTETVTGAIWMANLPADGKLAVRVDLQTIVEGSGVDDASPFSPTGSLPLERAAVGPDGDGNAEHEFTLPVLINGLYTHIVIEATSGGGERRCIELESPTSPDERTACMFIPLPLS